MEIERNVDLILNENKNNEFLNNILYKTINNGLDISLRYILPDLVEDEVINIKNNLLNYGLKDGIKKTIDSIKEIGRETFGIVTGNFENITQIKKIINNGGVIDKISSLLDNVIDKARYNNKIDGTISKVLKNEKSSILNSVKKNIESTLDNQISKIENIEKYITNWREYYNNKDFINMEKEYNKIEKELPEIIPIEKTIKNARYVENIHNLIKNNQQKFELTEEQLRLAEKLIV